MMKDWIAEYQPKNEEDTLSALREIMQEVVLAGLSRQTTKSPQLKCLLEIVFFLWRILVECCGDS